MPPHDVASQLMLHLQAQGCSVSLSSRQGSWPLQLAL
jgi:hypothetical protein